MIGFIKTIWIEANPKIFIDLQNNVTSYVSQRAFNILLYEVDDKEFLFNISNNDGASSSIYDFGTESLKDNLKMIETIKLKSKKLIPFFYKIQLTVKNMILGYGYTRSRTTSVEGGPQNHLLIVNLYIC